MCVLLKSHRYVAIVDTREEIVVAAAALIKQEISPDQKISSYFVHDMETES
jgi:hypothetical protein